jgi:hypothetical protein
MKAISVFGKKGGKRTGEDAVLLLQLLQVRGNSCARRRC